VLDAAGRIDEDISCIACGYNLRGLSPDSICPECATPIGRSIKGDLLRFCPPDWVETLASGMNWIVAGLIISFFGGTLVAGVMAVRTGNQVLASVLVQALGIIGLTGYWKVTTPDPATEEDGITARRLVRFTAVFGYALALAEHLAPAGVPSESFALGVGLIGGTNGLVKVFAVFIYARRLALRIPDPKLAKETRIVMWGWVAILLMTSVAAAAAVLSAGNLRADALANLFTVLGCFAAVAALGYGLWSLVLIFRYRRQLGDAALRARTTWVRELA
jgi:hypothetical protein